ncbi:hypothetical protein ASE43_17465 [Lysobacter sp. Root983]|nr:hypothetical protein ASE43_17465 [Lysobacter sp. Root983]
MLLQFDNSTMFQEDEPSVIRALGFDEILSGEHESRTLIVDTASDENSSVRAKLVLLIVFGISFEWNMYFVSSESARGQGLGLLDGVVCFFGDEARLSESINIIERFGV